MIQFIIAIALLMVPIFIYLKLNDRWQKRVRITFWLTIWIYPVLYLVYSSNPEHFGWILGFLGITFLITAASFVWEGGFRTRGTGDDDPAGNQNITKNFIDHM